MLCSQEKENFIQPKIGSFTWEAESSAPDYTYSRWHICKLQTEKIIQSPTPDHQPRFSTSLCFTTVLETQILGPSNSTLEVTEKDT